MTGIVVLAVSVLVLSSCARVEDAAFQAGIEAERARSGVDTAALAMDWGTLRFLERPGTGATVLLIHGFGAEKDIWLGFVRRLPEPLRVIIPDLPGHGESDRPARHIDLDDLWFARQIAALADTLALPAHHVVGNSMGGLIAARYALHHPERLLSLTLIDPAGVVSPEPSELERMIVDGDNPLIVRDGEDLDRLMALVYHEPPLIPWPARPALVRRMSARAAFLERLWDDLWHYSRSLEDDLDDIVVPTLILWGREDRILHVSAADVFARRIGGARLLILDAVGHSPMTEAPERTASAWLEFAADGRLE